MDNIKHPLSLFSKWYSEEISLSRSNIPSAGCLSTIGIDNFPNARFVSLKELKDNSLIITGSLNSRKGAEIENNDKVALTFWWTETQRQVRVQGLASKISEAWADTYFTERNPYHQAVSSICEQGKEINDLTKLQQEILEKVSENTKIERPENWSGITIIPLRIEFMEFKQTRFHDRTLYEIESGVWKVKRIQP